MPRILAVDFGTKRTGLAVTDPLVIIATALTTVPSHTLMDFLREYFSKEDVSEVVFGYPKNLDGSPTDATGHVNAVVNRFRKQFPDKKVILHDERFTSKMAHATMLQVGLKKSDRREKATVDRISATIILQSYLLSR